MPKPKKATPIQIMLQDASVPIDHRLELLAGLVNHSGEANKAILAALLESPGGDDAEEVHAQKARELSELMKQISEGPLRNAVFIQLVQTGASSVRHAQVVLDDGALAYTVVPDAELAASLRMGDRVILEGKGRALLQRAVDGIKIGEVVELERWADERHVVAAGRNGEKCVLLASQILADKFKAGQAAPGASLVINSRQAMAFDELSKPDGLAHFRFLVKDAPPDVIAARDIGAPPKVLEELKTLIRQEMMNPELRRRYRLPRCVMKLFAGVSGSGKTLAIHAIWRLMYEIMSEVTGTPVDQLPPRVFRLRISEVLSMWLGESDKNLDRFFAEVEQMADEPFTAADGKQYKLPVLVILEEIDGIARARGTDPIYDRILTTALQRLDPTRPELRKKFIIYIGTTNEAQHVDRAFLRRIGGETVQFSRLNKKAAFVAVLQKHLDALPLCSNNGHTPAELQRDIVADVAAWLFSPNGHDKGVVELTYAGSTTPQMRHRRDFLTGDLVRRAVTQAAEQSCKAEDRGEAGAGVSLETLIRAFDQQIRSVTEQINEHNVGNYTDVPDGVRVATLRRVPQPTLLPQELQRR